MPRKKKEPALSREAALDIVRRLMKSTGFDEEEQEGDRIHFGSREGGDMEEDRADPALVRFARTKAKEIEAAVPGSKVRVEPVDEWVTIDVTLPSAGPRTKPLKVGDAVEIPSGLGDALVGTITRIFNNDTASESAEVRVEGYAPSYHPTRTLKKTRRRPERVPPKPTPPTPPAASAVPPPKPQRSLRPGDEVDYTNFTIGGSHKGKAIVTWDHGKSVEARTLGGERLRLERAGDGSLRRFT